MELASIHSGYQTANSMESRDISSSLFHNANAGAGMATTSVQPNSNITVPKNENDVGAERLKLLQLKTTSYSTTTSTNDTNRFSGGGEGNYSKPMQDDSEPPMESSFTAIIPLESDESGSGDDNGPGQQLHSTSKRRKSSGLFASMSPAPASVQIWGYRRDSCLLAVTIFLCILSVGVLALILYWKPKWWAAMTALPCKLSHATLILIRDEHEIWSLEKVQILHRTDGITFLDSGGTPCTGPTVRVFDHRKIRFVWHPKRSQFQILGDFDQYCPLSVYYQRQELGLTQQMTFARSICYGKNEMHVELTPIIQLLFRECLQPLSIFQVFSVILWFTQTYVLFACVIIFMTFISWAVNVYSVRKSQRDLRRMVGPSGMVSILRDGVVQTLPSKELVPGDVLLLDPEADCGRSVDYDALIISGGCVMNESALTGESVPVTKTSLFYTEGAPKEIFDYRDHGKHVIYAGTKLLQIRSSVARPARLVVIRTGFRTAKGRLVRSILFPKPIDYRFTKDLLTFLLILGTIGIIGMIYALIILSRFKQSTYLYAERVLDIITVVVPPLLPAAMSVGVVLAQNRLRKKKIYCISASTINACGSVDAVCFDKTGTLTEDGLALTQVRSASRGRFNDEIPAQAVSGFSINGNGSEKHVVRLMATCHTLVLLDHDDPLDSSRDKNRIGGDPVDVALFEKTAWRLKKPGGLTIVQHPGCVAVVEGPPAIGDDDREKFLILQQFIFTSNLKRMSVIVRDQVAGTYSAYCKGAPETIKTLCLPETIPEDYEAILTDYTREGCRVISMAVKKIHCAKDELNNSWEFDPKQWSRDRVECDMAFVGFAVLENRLKSATTPIIYELKNANIRTVMITGDHVDTAVHVARQCGIAPLDKKLYLIDYDQHGRHPILIHISVPHNMEAAKEDTRPLDYADLDTGGYLTYQFAITGPVFAQLCMDKPDLLPRLVAVCSIYARMAPDQKTQVVTLLQSIGYVVAACGDGANDCGALKAAHAGVSLSEAEASVASPFTSQIGDISCIPTLISEGRAALVTSFGLAKYMVAYSFIQFFTVCLAYAINGDLANNQFVLADLFLVTLLSAVFGRTPAEERLCVKQPQSRLVSPPIIIGMFLHALVTALFQGMAFGVITQQPWFNGTVIRGASFGQDRSMQITAAFLASTFQYIWMAFVLSKGRPYRKPFYYNWIMLVMGIVQISLCVGLAMNVSQRISDIMYFWPAPDQFYQFCWIVMAVVNLLVYVFVEMFLVDWLFLKKLDEKKEAGLVATWLSGRRQSPTYDRIIRLIGDNPNWITNSDTKI